MTKAERLRYQRRWYQTHAEKHKEYFKKHRILNPEKMAVVDHYKSIFQRCTPSYVGMPFFDGWNPQKGGSHANGAKWIIENIGKRPGSGKEYHLHIVNRSLGFVPGNLAWLPRQKHRQEELVNKLLLEIQNLRIENKRLRAAL